MQTHIDTFTGETIIYDDAKHHYYSLDGRKLLGASTYAKDFGDTFNKDAILPRLARQWEMPEEHLDHIWSINAEISNSYGTAIHAAMELWFRYHKDGARISSLKGNEHNYCLPKNVYLRDIVLDFVSTFGELDGVPEATLSNTKKGMAGRTDIIILTGEKTCRVGDFKGLAVDTPIPTPLGFTTMGALSVGDEVYTRSGKTCKVVNKSEVHHKKCYEVKFRNGAKVVADHDHRWQVIAGECLSKSEMKESVLETTELLPGMRIGVSKPIVGEKKHLPIDPYVLGVWLGDGNRCAATLTFPNQDIWDEIVSRGYKLSKDYSPENRCETRRILGMEYDLKRLNLLKNKHIPDIYMTASYEQRLDLLRGLFDSDGHWNKTRRRVVMSTTQEWQRDATVALVSSLGIKASVHEFTAKGFGLTKQAWHIDFAPVFNPFLIRNQNIKLRENTKLGDLYYIHSIEEVDTVPTQCIEVDSEDHTYLFGYHYIPTHNTNNDLNPDKLLKYQHQLSFYADMLSEAGWTVEGLDIYHHDGSKWVGIPLDVLEVHLTEKNMPTGRLSTVERRPPAFKSV